MRQNERLFHAWQAKLTGAAASGGTNAAAREETGNAAYAQRRQESEGGLRVRGEAERRKPVEAAPNEQEEPDATANGLPVGRPFAAAGRMSVAAPYSVLPGVMAQGAAGLTLASGWQQDDAANGSPEQARAAREAQEVQSMNALSDRFERDARRYDGGFLLY